MKWLLGLWDDFIYRHACETMRRKCERNPGFAYLLELTARDYREQNPPSPEVMRSTELFFQAMKDLKKI